MKRILGLAGLIFFNVLFTSAQRINNDYIIRIQKADSEIIIDGELNEAAWIQADVARNFYMVLPMDTSKAKMRTDVRVTYDQDNFYISAVCFDDLPGGYIVESMRRDFSFGLNDNFLVFIDPFDDRTNGFSFGANAAGAQWDGLMYGGGSVDLSWDNKWSSAVKNYKDKWIFEARIPFKSIRYKNGITEWGINFSRLDLKVNEKSAWAPVPRQFPTASLAYTGIMQWDEPPPVSKSNISIIPYLAGEMSRIHELNEDTKRDIRFGGDAKIAVTSALNLDLTANPDFSQVEVDRQVTNLSRFELFFPERRQFFIENSDLFASFGFRNIRPFFSRRIGLESPIYFGARLSGKIDENWRIGAMDIQTGSVDSVSLPAQNFGVLALQRQVFARSNISAIFINKRSINYNPETDPGGYSKYNRNLGLEYNLASADNLWNGKFMFHKSFSEGVNQDDYTGAVDLEYDAKKINVEFRQEYVGENYNAEVGYVPRKAYYRTRPEIRYNFFPNSEKIVSHGPFLASSIYLDQDFNYIESESWIGYGIQFLNRSHLAVWLSEDYVKLSDPFDPTNSGGDSLVAGTGYNWNAAGLEYNSSPGNLITYEISSRYGGYYNGKRFNVSGFLGYRFQPYGNINMSFSVNDIELPEPYNDALFWLVGPRIDVTFTNNIFLTTFIQYNEQLDNLNINTRFQWRYKPASDFYIVYTDNYLPSNFNVKSRALVFKFTYWWNI